MEGHYRNLRGMSGK